MRTWTVTLALATSIGALLATSCYEASCEERRNCGAPDVADASDAANASDAASALDAPTDVADEPPVCDRDAGCECVFDSECADGFGCNGIERCKAGKCTPGVPVVCWTSNPDECVSTCVETGSTPLCQPPCP